MVKLSNVLHFYQGGIPLTITNEDSLYTSMANKSCIIENYNIEYFEGVGRSPFKKSYNDSFPTPPDLPTNNETFDAYINGNVTINNFFRTTNYGVVEQVTCAATRITLDGSTSFDDYNCNTANSISCIIVNGTIASSIQSINNGILNRLFAAGSGRTFLIADGTYFYKAIFLVGDRRCLLATSTDIPELNQVITPIPSQYPFNAPSFGDLYIKSGRSFTLRLYRGMISGTYDYYIDIPYTCFDTLIDYGYYTNTGHYWNKRISAGAIDTFNTATAATVFTQNADGTKVVKLDAPPTVGVWKVGDKIERITPVQGSNEWICSSASPLTFIPQ